jgi:hypothetical protein
MPLHLLSPPKHFCLPFCLPCWRSSCACTVLVESQICKCMALLDLA